MLRALFLVTTSIWLILIQGQNPPGGHHPVSPDDPSLAPAIVFAAAGVNADCVKCKFCQTVVNVTNATEQVVDGTVYQFFVSLQESDQCLVEECMGSVPDNKCPPNPKAKPYWCWADLAIKSWSTPTHFINNLTCQYPPDY